MNYYRRYMGDYAIATAHLTLAEHGAYTLLLDAQYAKRGPLPADLEVLCKMCRATTAAERRAVKSVAEEFFPVQKEGSGRVNPRAGIEIEKASKAIEKMSAAGRKGAHYREAKRMGAHKGTHKGTHEPTLKGSGNLPLRVTEDPPTTNLDTSLRSVSDPAVPLRSTAAADAAPDVVIWDLGLGLLTRSGVPEKQARTFLGGLRKKHGDAELAEVIGRCAAEKPCEPKAWIVAALGDRRREVVV